MQHDAAQDTVDSEADSSLHVGKAGEPLPSYNRFLDAADIVYSRIAYDQMLLPCSVVSSQKDMKLRTMMN